MQSCEGSFCKFLHTITFTCSSQLDGANFIMACTGRMIHIVDESIYRVAFYGYMRLMFCVYAKTDTVLVCQCSSWLKSSKLLRYIFPWMSTPCTALEHLGENRPRALAAYMLNL